jgi:release factor glutamine methyltransferase
VRISEMVSYAEARFREAGIRNPLLDAELLTSHYLGLDRMRLHVDRDRELTAKESGGIMRFIKRRLAFEPVAYILGKKEFYSLDFSVTRDVLIPRPETELVVDLVVYYARLNARVVDIGTGSGSIAVSVKYTRQDLEVHATDISSKALSIARKNASAILGKNKIKFHQGDLFGPLAGLQFQVIAANPPYVDKTRAGSYQKDLCYEPGLALFSSNEGTAAIDKIVGGASSYLEDGGCLIMEIGDTMKDYVGKTGKNRGFSVSVLNDYSGLPRVAVMKR